MTRQGLNIGLLVLAVVLGTVAVWQLRRGDAPAPPPPDRSDYVLRDFELILLNDEGSESFTVRGPYLQREPGAQSLSLRKPRFSFPGREGGRWNARSATAWVAAGAKEVRLLDAVVMQGPVSPDGLRTRFETDRLDIFPDQDLARTEARVTVTQGDSILAGTGLRADMKARRYQLLTDVKGHYAPRP